MVLGASKPRVVGPRIVSRASCEDCEWERNGAGAHIAGRAHVTKHTEHSVTVVAVNTTVFHGQWARRGVTEAQLPDADRPGY